MKSIKNEVKEFIWTALYSSVACEIGAIAANRYLGYNIDYIAPALIAVGVTAINRTRIFKRSPQVAISMGFTQQHQFASSQRGLFQSIIKWSKGGYAQPEPLDLPPNYVSRKIRYDDIVPRQIYWDVKLKNRRYPVRVFEDDLRRLVYRAAARQHNPDIPYPLSRPYFTKEFRPPFSYSEYEALIWLLRSCNLIYGRQQGSSGKLYLFRPPSSLITFAITMYGSLSDD